MKTYLDLVGETVMTAINNLQLTRGYVNQYLLVQVEPSQTEDVSAQRPTKPCCLLTDASDHSWTDGEESHQKFNNI
jgi:hypothetical protein